MPIEAPDLLGRVQHRAGRAGVVHAGADERQVGQRHEREARGRGPSSSCAGEGQLPEPAVDARGTTCVNSPPAASSPPTTISGFGPSLGTRALAAPAAMKHAERGRAGTRGRPRPAVAEHLLEVEAQEEERADQPGADQRRGQVRPAAVAVEHDPHRQQRVAGPQLEDDEGDHQQHADADERQRPRLASSALSVTARRGVLLRVLGHPGEAVDERGQAEGDEHRAGDVVAGVTGRLALRHDRDRQRRWPRSRPAGSPRSTSASRRTR